MKNLVLIPARRASTRLPDKMLADLGGKALIQRTFLRLQTANITAKIVVATDDEAIVEPLIFRDETDSQQRAKRIRARTRRLAPYLEALTEAQSDLARENVFVFLHQSTKEAEGKVVALPAGSVVLDAIRYCELPASAEDLISHNGKPASLTRRLVNGDVLSLPSLTALVTQSL